MSNVLVTIATTINAILVGLMIRGEYRRAVIYKNNGHNKEFILVIDEFDSNNEFIEAHNALKEFGEQQEWNILGQEKWILNAEWDINNYL